MAKASAGLLLYRFAGVAADAIEVLLVHPGGPFWARKDEGAWSIPKGEYESGDDPLLCARLEFLEEVGSAVPDGALEDLGEVTQGGGKRVHVWALEGDLDVTSIDSNTFELEWPPRSNKLQSFPEVDKAGWFALDGARQKLNPAQVAFLDRLVTVVSARGEVT